MENKTVGSGMSQASLPTFDVSDRLVRTVKMFEGFRPKAELDALAAKPVWTIGYGETMGVQMGDECTPEQAEERLRIRLRFYSRCVQRMVKVPLTQGMHDALTDFCYNLGQEALRGSTLLRLLNAGYIESAAEQFKRWVYAGGDIQPGLIRRRVLEKLWFTEHIAETEAERSARHAS